MQHWPAAVGRDAPGIGRTFQESDREQTKKKGPLEQITEYLFSS